VWTVTPRLPILAALLLLASPSVLIFGNPPTVKTATPLPILSFNSATWTTEQGLPGDTVRAITQTRDGYLWIATQAGLARFDGVRFTVFSKPTVKEFRTNECNVLLEARDGTLWIGTIGGGLMRYRDGHFSSYGRGEGLATDVINGLYEDREGRLWITSYETLTLYEKGTFKSFSTADAEHHVYAVPFHEDEAGRLWCFNSRGINLNNTGAFLFFKDGQLHPGAEAEQDFASGNTLSPFAGRNGVAWIIDRKAFTLSRLAGGQKENTRASYPGKDTILLAHEDAAGDLWFMAARDGLRFVHGSEVYRVTTDSLPAAAINLIYSDREGNLWIGSSAGLTRLKRQAFRPYTTADGLSNEAAWTIFEDSRRDLWIGTNSGVNKLKDQKFSAYGVTDGMAANGAVSITEDAEGRLWFASTLGLTSLWNGTFLKYSRQEGLLSENVRSVFVDSHNRCWIGSLGGLQLFENGQFKSFTTANGLSHNNVLFIHEDQKGDLWIGTPNGLNRMRDGRFEVFKTEQGLSSNIVIAARETPAGTIWFGTVGGGLVRFRNGKFAAITSASGLGDDTITTILEDDNSNLWLGSTRGVLRVSRAELDEFADGARHSIMSVAYGKADGLPSSDCSGGTQPAGWRAQDGRLWFPTAKGIAVVDPRSLQRNALPPPVVIEGLTVDREAQTLQENLTLVPGSRAVEISFTALSFKDPSRVRFRYQLEGFEPAWVDIGTRREAFFTNLKPGRYSFRVIAANDDGVWNEQGSTLVFILQPYFYQTVWFYLACALLLAAAMWGIHLLRVRQLRREFTVVLQERNRIARELHDTLAQGFTSVSMLLEAVSAKVGSAPEAAREHLNQARLLVRSSLAEARRSVRDLRSEMLEDGDLSGALRKIAQQLTAGTDVRAEIKISGRPRPLPNKVEMALLRAGQEALTNAIRHAGPRQLKARLEYSAAQVTLKISDDGKGFEPDSVNASTNGGFGLKGMRERLAEIGGEVKITSQIGDGSEICVVVPTGK
jgi:signal transduction histidine kinase/ligand-binding sensor domain-containing protein